MTKAEAHLLLEVANALEQVVKHQRAAGPAWHDDVRSLIDRVAKENGLMVKPMDGERGSPKRGIRIRGGE